MTEYSKYNIIYRLQRWLDSVPGQTFLNYAYSWGASIVILGTLFKLTHMHGANLMLYIGMGTEVIVFFISAFDRPFDKTAIGKDLPTHVTDELVEQGEAAGEPAAADVPLSADGEAAHAASTVYAGNAAGGMVIVGGVQGGNVASGVAAGTVASGAEPQPADGIQGSGYAAVADVAPAGGIVCAPQMPPELEEATANYVDELKKLTETLSKVAEQSARLTRDSDEMENLNRTLTGICKVYEMQLKGASSQIGTIDQINEQSRKMASQIEQLNKIYARMIEAMTVNMRATTANGNNSEV